MGKIPPYKWTHARDTELRKLWATPDITVIEIGDRFGLSDKAVRRRAIELGLPKRTTGRPCDPNRYYTANYWATVPSGDDAFARALAASRHGHAFDSLSVSRDPRKLHHETYNPGMGASSMTLNG